MSQNIIGTSLGAQYLPSGTVVSLSTTYDYTTSRNLSEVTQQTTCFCCGKDLREEKRVIHVEFDQSSELVKCKECPKAQGMFCELCVNEKHKMIEHIKTFHRSVELVDDSHESIA